MHSHPSLDLHLIQSVNFLTHSAGSESTHFFSFFSLFHYFLTDHRYRKPIALYYSLSFIIFPFSQLNKYQVKLNN